MDMDLSEDNVIEDTCASCSRQETEQYPLFFCSHEECKKFFHEMCHNLRTGGTEGHTVITKEEFYYNHRAFLEGPQKAEEMKQNKLTQYFSGNRVSKGITRAGDIIRDVGFHVGAANAIATSALAIGTKAIEETFRAMGKTNLIVSAVVFAGNVAIQAARWYRGDIDKYQFGKTVLKSAARTAGGLGGFAAGAGLGSFVGPIGTIIGGIIGGILGGTLTAFFLDEKIEKMFPGPEELVKREMLKEAMEMFNANENVTLAEIDSEFRNLAKVYHPDRRTGSHAMFCHLSALRDILIEHVVQRDGIQGAPRVSDNAQLFITSG